MALDWTVIDFTDFVTALLVFEKAFPTLAVTSLANDLTALEADFIPADIFVLISLNLALNGAIALLIEDEVYGPLVPDRPPAMASSRPRGVPSLT